MGLLAKPLAILLGWIYGFVQNYGISLIVFTIIVKLVTYPLYVKQTKSSIKMAELQPKLKELQQKYANDRAMYNEKAMELQQREGVSMGGGCLPMLVNTLVIFGMFALLRNPILFFGAEDDMILATHESFLWIKDLGQTDLWILPILSAAATFFSSVLNSAMMASTTANPQQAAGMNNIMKYVFPVTILWFARTYPAGLALYWFVGNFIQILFSIRLNKLRKASDTKKNIRKKAKKARA